MNPPPTRPDDAVRRALLQRLTGIVVCVVVAGGGFAFLAHLSINDPYGGTHDVMRARDVVASQPHVTARVVGYEDLLDSTDFYREVVVRLPDGSYAEVWTLQTGLFSLFFGGPDNGERLQVAVDPAEPTWAASVDDAQASIVDHARYVLFDLGPLVVMPFLALRLIFSAAGSIPLRAYRALRHPRVCAAAEVLTIMHTRKRANQAVTLRIRVNDDEYSWDATLPKDCVPYVGGVLDLRGDIEDGGWVMAVDAQHGTAWPRARLRKWGSEPPTQSWHPTTRHLAPER
ncbi:hypothetical protein FE697_007085 [Mumia zhuanghuii]|uniref:DUF2207 domain-containing protein n=2 Tax=Mumia TaxID=1546255 RepID=A0ABW1QMB7_9ACTN|nr:MULTISPECIES: hypothetical protein [Mumia]KAA1423370.1 hypothetical protein FE697_007085 [Mumia zhuanghuii]